VFLNGDFSEDVLLGEWLSEDDLNDKPKWWTTLHQDGAMPIATSRLPPKAQMPKKLLGTSRVAARNTTSARDISEVLAMSRDLPARTVAYIRVLDP
jgi:hypothetical protein